MLRVVFIGQEISIINALDKGPVELLGVYLPHAPYWMLQHMRPMLKLLPLRILKKISRTLVLYGKLFAFLDHHRIASLYASQIHAPDFLDQLVAMKPDLGIVANFGQILKNSLLRIPRYGFINLHPSLLPLYPGPYPVEEILANRDTESGATWFQMTESIDSGPVLAQKAFPISAHDTPQTVLKKSIDVGLSLLYPLLEQIETASVHPINHLNHQIQTR